MKEIPNVTVIVPFYNVEPYIEKCLNSLVNQTLENIEIILINDGSTDNSYKIAERYFDKYPGKIKYLKKENGGLSDARNFGMKFATGEYIAFLDSDDYIELNAYKEMYEKAKSENLDYVECDFIWEYDDESKTYIDKKIPYTDKKEMLSNVRVVAWNKLIKREILEKNKISFPKGLRYEDVEFTYKLIPYLNSFGYVEKPFIHYLQRENSIVNSQNIRTQEIFTILENVEKYYKEKGFFEEYKVQLEYNFARYLLCSSLKRICKIKDKEIRKKLIKTTWEKLNSKYPNWKKNSILNQVKNSKNMYMKTVNKFTYKLYSFVFTIK